jgi:ubiquinone/menaquinone biosynthesis C-methylase UbiE
MSDNHIRQTIQVYDKTAQAYAKQAIVSVPFIERDKFTKMISPQAVVLDLGCGSGRDVRYFTDLGCHVTGVDLSEKLLEIAHELTPQAIFKMQDIRKLIFPENTFDAIWSCASLVHLKKSEVPDVLLLLYKILKPKGIIHFTLKAGSTEGYKIEPSIPDQARYYSLFTKGEFGNLVKNAGFTILENYSYKESERGKTDRNTEWIACFAKKL